MSTVLTTPAKFIKWIDHWEQMIHLYIYIYIYIYAPETLYMLLLACHQLDGQNSLLWITTSPSWSLCLGLANRYRYSCMQVTVSVCKAYIHIRLYRPHMLFINLECDSYLIESTVVRLVPFLSSWSTLCAELYYIYLYQYISDIH